MTRKIFINYRRDDDAGYTIALRERLEVDFPDLFMDADLKAGRDFVAVLTRAVAECDVLLAVIGRRWLELLVARASDPKDFVVIEIKAALDQGKHVIPVLVGGAMMPRAEALPESVRELAYRHAVRLTPERFRNDCQGLIAELKEYFETVEEAEEAPRRKREAEEAAHRRRETEEWGLNSSATIKWRTISAILLSATLAVVFWLMPGLELTTFSSSPDGAMVFGYLFAAFWLYLVVQGYPISHGEIGSSSTDNLDNIITALPALVALFGILLSMVGFWTLSGLNLFIAAMVLQIAFYDLWILGGAASKINRLTDEFRLER